MYPPQFIIKLKIHDLTEGISAEKELNTKIPKKNTKKELKSVLKKVLLLILHDNHAVLPASCAQSSLKVIEIRMKKRKLKMCGDPYMTFSRAAFL